MMNWKVQVTKDFRELKIQETKDGRNFWVTIPTKELPALLSLLQWALAIAEELGVEPERANVNIGNAFDKSVYDIYQESLFKQEKNKEMRISK